MTTFKAGETYRTRDGREARVYATDCGGDWPIHGAFRGNDGEWRMERWSTEGCEYRGANPSGVDLLPPAPPSPPAFDEASWRAGAEAMREKIIIGLNSRNTLVMSADSVARHTEIPPPPSPSPEPERKYTRLADCPVGLFWFGDTLGFKSEYGDNSGRIDAFIVESGEFLWGPAPQTVGRQRELLVEPVPFERTALLKARA